MVIKKVIIINISQNAKAKNKMSIYNGKISSKQIEPTTWMIYTSVQSN